MKSFLKSFASTSAVLAISLGLASVSAHAKNPVITIDTSMGKIKVQLNQAKAPITVKNFLTYVKEKQFDGTIFHRVIPSFMIQGGGMMPDMTEKPTHDKIKNEGSNGLKNEEGTISMARTNDPDSATAQFFINVANNKFLDHSDSQPGYAVFGKVISGMDVVHKIEHVTTATKLPHENVPVDPVIIKTIRVSK